MAEEKNRPIWKLEDEEWWNNYREMVLEEQKTLNKSEFGSHTAPESGVSAAHISSGIRTMISGSGIQASDFDLTAGSGQFTGSDMGWNSGFGSGAGYSSGYIYDPGTGYGSGSLCAGSGMGSGIVLDPEKILRYPLCGSGSDTKEEGSGLNFLTYGISLL